MLTTARAFSVLGALALSLVWTDSFAQTAIHTQSDIADSFFWGSRSATINGDVHSNGGIEIGGRQHTLNGAVTHVGTLVDTYAGTSDETTFSTPPSVSATRAWPITTTITDFAPGGQYAIEAGAEYFDVSINCVNNWVTVDLRGPTPQEGTYYATCRMKVYMDGTSGKFTFASTSKIQFIAFNDSNFEAHTGITAAFSDAVDDQAINLDRKGTIITGRLIAPNGHVRVVGSWHQLRCGVYADRVRIGTFKATVEGSCPLLANQAPVANDDLVDANTETPIDIDVLANDTDADGSLDSSTVTVVANGSGTTQVLSSGQIRFTSNVGFVGTTIFTYTVADDQGTVSNVGEVRVEVTSPNQPPVATPDTLTVDEDGTASINVLANDFDGETALDIGSFLVVDAPDNGFLFLDEPMGTVRYEPDPDFNGIDQFSYTVADDEGLVSTPAAVDITVTAVNDGPVAQPVTLTVDEDTSGTFDVLIADPDSSAFTFSVIGGTQLGALSGTLLTLTYTPPLDFSGTDTFELIVNDGAADAAPITVTATVTAQNDAPQLSAMSVVVPEDQFAPVPLTITDPDSSSFTLIIETPPMNGALSGAVDTLTYTPIPNFFGTDAFAIRVSDGTAQSEPMMVNVQVIPTNDAPTANTTQITVDEDDSVAVLLSGVDIDGDALSFTIASGPSNGTIAGLPPSLTYTPNTNFFGADSFSFTASDGQVTSAAAAVAVTVNAVNDAPVATSQMLMTDQGVAVAVNLTGSDVEGDGLAYQVTTQPTSGVLSGSAPSLTYTPTAGFSGEDSFTFVANDGSLDSAPGTVAIGVDQVVVGTPPEFVQLPMSRAPVGELYRSPGEVFDADGDAVVVSIASGPTEATVTDLGNNRFELTWAATGTVGAAEPFVLRATDSAGNVTDVLLDLLITGSTVDQTTLGTDFWLAYLQAARYDTGLDRIQVGDERRSLQLTIAAPDGATGQVEISSLAEDPSVGFLESFTLEPGETTTIQLPNEAVNRDGARDRSTAVHVTSDLPVQVAGFHWVRQASDAWLAIPTPSLGTSYQMGAYPSWSEGDEIIYGVVAVNPGTTDVTSTAEAGKVSRDPDREDDPRTVTILNQGGVEADSFEFHSGGQITTSQPTAVFAGAVCANVPTDFNFCNHLTEQITPESSLASEYVAAPLATRVGGALYRVIATEDNTVIRINGESFRVINDGELIERIFTGPVHIAADKPVLALQLSPGDTFDEDLRDPINDPQLDNADPFMIQLAPVDAYLSDYAFSVIDTTGLFPPQFGAEFGIQDHYIGVTIRANDADSLTIDGVPVDTTGFSPVGDTGFLAGSIRLEPGTHRAAANGLFGVVSYGYGPADGYGYYAGLAFPSRTTGLSITVTPQATTLEVGQQACFDIVVTNATGEREPRARYRASVAGVSAQGKAGFSNDMGEADYCYTQVLAGQDTIAFSVDGDQDTASMTWTPPGPGNGLPPVFTSNPVFELYDATYIYDVTVVDPNNDSVVVSVASAPVGMAYDSVSNQLAWTPPIPVDRESTVHSVELVATDSNGLSTSQIWQFEVHYPIEIVDILNPRIIPSGNTLRNRIDTIGGDQDLVQVRLTNEPPFGATLDWEISPASDLEGQTATSRGQWQYEISTNNIQLPEAAPAYNPVCVAPGSSVTGYQPQRIRSIGAPSEHGVAVGPVVDTNNDGAIDAADDIYSLSVSDTEATLYNLTADLLAWQFSFANADDHFSPALANIDADPELEAVIVARVSTGGPRNAIAIDTDGTPLWVGTHDFAQGLHTQLDRPVLVHDLDADGSAEIIVGGAVLNSFGALLWEFPEDETASANGRAEFAIPTIADLENDGSFEVLFSNQVRSASGALLWDLGATGLTDPHALFAVVDINDDAANEVIAIIYDGRTSIVEPRFEVRAFSATGAALWGPVPSRGFSIPVVADVDVDGELEVFIQDDELVIAADSSIERQSAGSLTQLRTEHRMPVFDLNRDGLYEKFVYRETNPVLEVQALTENFSWSFDNVLSPARSSDQPLQRGFAIADIDHDGSLDMVVGTEQSVIVLESASADWQGTPRDFRQFSDATYPLPGVDVAASAPAAQNLPDYWIGEFRIADTSPTQLLLSAEIRNLGIAPITETGTVRFYRGAVGTGVEIASVSVPTLGVGERATVTATVDRAEVNGITSAEVIAGPSTTQCATDNDSVEQVYLAFEFLDLDFAYRVDEGAFLTQVADRVLSPSIVQQVSDATVTVGEAFQAQPTFQARSRGDATVFRLLRPSTLPPDVPVPGIDAATGEIEWTPTQAAVGTHRIAYQAFSLAGQRSERSFLITVVPRANVDPEIVSTLPPLSIDEGRTFTYNVVATDADGDTLTYGLSEAPLGMTIDPISGVLSWFAPSAAIGDNPVTVVVTDGFGGNDTQPFVVTVNDIANAAPVITSTPSISEVTAGQTYTYDVTATDADGDTLSYSLIVSPAGMTIDSVSGQISWVTTAADIGMADATVRVSDRRGGSTDQSFDVQVIAVVNQPPNFTSTPPNTPLTIGDDFSYDADANDPEGGAVTYALDDAPIGVVIDASTGVVSWATGAAQAGDYLVVVRATDPEGQSSTQPFIITLNQGANGTPTITSTPAYTGRTGIAYVHQVIASDPDNDPLTYSLTTAPAGMTIDQSGLIQWTPSVTGTESVVVRVSDGVAFVEQGWAVTVTDGSQPLDATLYVLPTDAEVGDTIQLTLIAENTTGDLTFTGSVDGDPIAMTGSGTGSFVATTAGSLNVQASVTDSTGTVTRSTTVIVTDPQNQTDVPVVNIVAPAIGEEVTAPTDVIASVADDNLAQWTLLLLEDNRPNQEAVELASGTTAFTDSVIAQVDPTMLLNGQYLVILQAEDLSGNVANVAHPIRVTGDMKVGNFSLTFEDLSLPVAGIPITVTRTYDTRQRNKLQDFGYGWTIDYQNVRVHESRDLGFSWTLTEERQGILTEQCVRPNGDPTVTVTLPDGEVETFVARAIPECTFGGQPFVNIVFEPRDFTSTSLRQTSFGLLRIINNNLVDPGQPGVPVDPTTYELTTDEGVVYELDQEFGIRRVTDTHGNSLTYSETGILHSDGYSVDFVRDSEGRIEQINIPDGTSLQYDYDVNGDLVQFTDQVSQSTTFTYELNQPHYLDEILDPRGIRAIRNEYDADGRLISTTDADGNAIVYTHNIAGRQELVRDRRGFTTEYIYDDEGNVLSETNLALSETIVRTYDADRNVLTETDGEGVTMTMTYDERGNVLTETNEFGEVTTYTYDERNLVETITDPEGNVTINDYDTQNTNLLSTRATTIDGDEQLTEFVWDSGIDGSCSTGTLRVVRDAEGHVRESIPFCIGPFAELPRLEFDQNGVLTLIFYNPGDIWRKEREETQWTDGNGVLQTLVTSYEYDEKGRVTRVTYPDGTFTRTEYDLIDKPAATYDELGRVTRMEYDDRGNLERTIYPDLTTETMTYDENGNVITQTDRQGRVTRMVYDAANRLVETIHPDATPGDETDNPRTLTDYDLAGRVEATTDENSNRTEYEYDEVGRQVLVRDALNQITRYQYDRRGLRTAMIDNLGRRTDYIYDGYGRLTETIMPAGVTDSNGQRLRSRIGYDDIGRKISETDPAGVVTTFEYDPVGNLTRVTDALGGITTYTYDELNNKRTQTDSENHTTTWTYDERGRPISRILPDGIRNEIMVYDAVGNLTFHTDFNGETTEYRYDNMNRRERVIHDLLDGRPDHTMSYNDSGLVTSVTDERGTTSYVYDERDRLIQVTNADGAVIDYGYDPAGNRISLATVNQSITYGYDDLNRLETVNDGNGTTTYSYDGVGNRDQVDHANGTRTRYTYDDLNRLTQLVNEGPAPTRELISQHGYTLGDAGNRLQLDEILAQPGSPSVTRNTTYVYDNLYRLTQESVTDTSGLNKQTTWTYDTVGNRLTETRTGGSNPGSTSYVYDANDWIQSETTGSTVTTYTYDDNGNTLIKSVDSAQVAAYTYDSDNRMVQANITDAGVTTATFYGYDVNGIRQSETTGGITRDYLVDINLAYAQVIEESDNVAGLTRMYLHGDDLLTQSRVANGNPATSTIDTYLYDGLGSVRSLASETGSISDTYVYQAFGDVEVQNGTTQNRYLYTGEQYDPNVGFYYLRARYYNPSIGRFQTMDTYAGRMHEPATLHKYLYTHADPVNMVDPSGLFGLAEASVGIAIVNILTSMRIDNAFNTFDTLGVENSGIQTARSVNRIWGLVNLGYAGAKIARIFSSKLRKFLGKTPRRLGEFDGPEFEEYLKALGGSGPFKKTGSSKTIEFDGEWGNVWFEAKSSWYLIAATPARLQRFRTKTGDAVKVASENGRRFAVVSQGSIPAVVRDWLDKKGIQYVEML